MGTRKCHICQTRYIAIGMVVCCDACWAVAKLLYGSDAREKVYDDRNSLNHAGSFSTS